MNYQINGDKLRNVHLYLWKREAVKIKLICLAIALMIPARMFGGNDIMEKQLLQYKYVIFFQQISPFEKKKQYKVYYIDRAEIQKTVSWIKNYYPDPHALDTHMLAKLPHCCIIFINKLPTNLAEMLNHNDDEKLFWDIYLNFDIDGKKYFTKDQLALLYKIFEEKGVPLKLDSGPIAEPRTKKMIIPEPSINSR